MDIEEQYDKIYRYCYFKMYDDQIAQDITQETFLRFCKQGLNLGSDKELPYLYTIAKNLCIDHFRRRTVESLEEITEEVIDDPTEDLISNLTLRMTISKLPEDEQELIFLRYVNEISVTAICKITGLSRFAVY
ncbi:MAG: RNA polymerase sigma factor, partial [Bacteroidales bacterium]|nr:RNA polymerase sigma factor [Bacteroidales bacterium]